MIPMVLLTRILCSREGTLDDCGSCIPVCVLAQSSAFQ